MKLDELSNEKIAELAKLETAEDVFAFAKDNLVDLTDDEVEFISGGRNFANYAATASGNVEEKEPGVGGLVVARLGRYL